jgi:hypothetical protein
MVKQSGFLSTPLTGCNEHPERTHFTSVAEYGVESNVILTQCRIDQVVYMLITAHDEYLQR